MNLFRTVELQFISIHFSSCSVKEPFYLASSLMTIGIFLGPLVFFEKTKTAMRSDIEEFLMISSECTTVINGQTLAGLFIHSFDSGNVARKTQHM